MANTRQSTKRAKQAIKRKVRNQLTKAKTRTVVKAGTAEILNFGSKSATSDLAAVQAAYLNAVKALSKAASKGVIPKKRASRKISRLTFAAQKKNAKITAQA